MKKKLPLLEMGEKMQVTLKQAKSRSSVTELTVSVPLSSEQMKLIALLNDFAIHQAEYNAEVREFPAKMMYKVNDELKLALVALLTSCSMLDPLRNGNETQQFFEKQIKIIQGEDGQKKINFGIIRPKLVQESIFEEIVDDWILYRDVNGDGIHALVDRKTYLQGLSSYARGGNPVYEFARFYRRFMENKISKKMQEREKIKEIAVKSLTDQVVQKKLESGCSPQNILDSILSDEQSFLSDETSNKPLRLTKK